MTDTKGDKSNNVYRRIEGTNPTNDAHTFNVLMAIDGVRSVSTIAREDHYDIEDLISVITQLESQGSIEPVTTTTSKKSRNAFFGALESQLSKIMGPVSNIVIQDNLANMGFDTSNFPMSKAHELVKLISRNIPGQTEAAAFIRDLTEDKP